MDELVSNPEPPAEPRSSDFYLTGVASSAGGLEALEPLVGALSAAAPMAYVVVQHLAPKHRSMLADLLSRDTNLRVEEVTDGVVPAPGVIYITPPNHDVEYDGEALRLLQPSHAIGPKPSADRFFRSLAEALGPRAVGVILSGTGSDGAAGAKAISEAGGIVLAQDPRTARYDGMPRAAIDTGVVSTVLAPAEIGHKLNTYAHSPSREEVFPAPEGTNDPLPLVLARVEELTGVDFSGYKPSTLRRRLARRVMAAGVPDTQGYLELLHQEPAEAQRFVKEALISVTAFFRDAEIFEQVRPVVDEIVARKRDGQSVRVWVPGCATGEEVYSLAILIQEAIRHQKRRLHVQIFATDIDEQAMAQARQGTYAEAALDPIPADMRERYFQRHGPQYLVTKELRDCVIFARHDVTRDTPFVRIDLVSCRNLLIYMTHDLQRDVLSSFHFALNADGFLVLGKSENTGAASDQFSPLSVDSNKVFRRNPMPSSPVIRPMPVRRPQEARSRSTPAELAIRGALIAHYQPKAMLVTVTGDIREVEGSLDGYLSFGSGKTQLNATKLLIPELRGELWTLLGRARKEKAATYGLAKETARGRVRLVVRPAAEDEHGQPLFLVVIEELNEALAGVAPPVATDRTAEIEQELTATREHLQSVIEELEVSNEELQAVNEELQASNEELQATSEEMETSNEELQATNEELTTVNDELRRRTAELQALNDQLENIQHSIGYAIVILDRRLRVLRYSREAVRYFGLTTADMGEPLAGIPMHLDIPTLHEKLGETLQAGTIHALEIETGRASLAVRIRPFVTAGGAIEGAVLLVMDETQYRQAQRRLAASEERFALAVQGSSDGVWDQMELGSDDGFWSPRMLQILGLPPQGERTSLEALEERVHPDERAGFRAALDRHLKEQRPFDVECRLRVGPSRHGLGQEDYGWFQVRGQAVWNRFGQPVRMAGSISDITKRKEAELRIMSLYEQLMRAEELVGVGHWRLEMRSGQMYWSDEVYRIHDAPTGFLPTLNALLHYVHVDDRAMFTQRIDACRRQGTSFRCEVRVVRADATVRYVDTIGEAERDMDGTVVAVFGVIHDITDKKLVEEQLRGRATHLDVLVNERNAELERRVRERELLLQELQHRIKNNLQMISSLIAMQKARHPEAANVLDSLAVRVGAVAFVYDLMVKRADTETADLVATLKEIAQASQANAPQGVRVDASFDEAECLVPADQASKLAMITQELIFNALKHAFPGRDGRINVRLGRVGTEWRLVVEDDGVGAAAESRAGRTGLGLQLVRSLLRDMDGRLERVAQRGTRFDVVFPDQMTTTQAPAETLLART
ncbi:MAG TPA: chemotaxis protein CheB [Azospirillaceae bacterium]|nr:chemotaxis protein CheB [Azospirillaceae bacterium]